MAHKRVVLKLSGEAMSGQGKTGLHPAQIEFTAGQILAAAREGTEIAVMMGGGNFLRGSQVGEAFTRIAADQMGMFATVINGLALRDVIVRLGGRAHVRSAFAVPGKVKPFGADGCRELMHRGSIVILTGGTGNPFFTTDTACALRCCELDADLMLKATKVDGVYSSDPKTDPKAKRYDRLGYEDVLDQRLGVMDLTAVELCRSQGIGILVFDFLKEGNIVKAVRGETVGTVIS
jgi:uridylate kinase